MEACAPSSFSETKALASCCLVCKDWVHVAMKALYCFVFLRNVRQLMAFASTIDAFSKNAARVGHNSRIDTYRTYSINVFEDFMGSPCIHLIPLLLSTKLPYLRTLNLRPWRYHGFSFRLTFIGLLPRFGSFLDHLILADTRFQSFLDFRRMIASLHSLSRLRLTNVGWGFNAALHLKPRLYTTSWSLSSVDAVKCQSPWHIPILWMIPSRSAQTRSFIGYTRGPSHPAISEGDAQALCGFFAALPYPLEVGWMDTQTATFRWKHDNNEEGTS